MPLLPLASPPGAFDDGPYDAVIIGSGIAGAIIALELTSSGKRVLVVEASEETDRTFAGYRSHLDYFYSQPSRDNQSPFPPNPNARMPRGSELRQLGTGETNTDSYMVQPGPYVTDTVYSRAFGGTTIHWEAKTPRMLPSDFETQHRFGQGRDWPISYGDMQADYEKAEREIGVSANAADQSYLGLDLDGYEFPMQGLPLSWLDQQVDAGIRGSKIEIGGTGYEVAVRPFPQGRNGIPNQKYDGGKGFRPQGAVASHQIDVGARCQGNTNCVPLCPVQAKYHSGKTLAKAFDSGRATLVSQAVASRVRIDPGNGRVTGIELKVYADPNAPDYVTRTVTGDIYVLAANAIETPRLMLASGLQDRSDQIGRNLMDHAYLLNWALMPQVCGTMRGTSCTGGIIDLRDGPFRAEQAAFSIDIHNDGWGWATGAPISDVVDLVDGMGLFGRDLRQGVIDRVSHQLMLAFMIEVMPVATNRVTVSRRYTDALGNPRPIVAFDVPDYSMRAAAEARRVSETLFARLNATDYTHYDPQDYGYIPFQGAPYAIRGGNHLAGTHVMGNDPATSCVNPDQKSWEHDNLYLVGAGSMPTIGTANVTLTMAALCYRSARAMVAQLGGHA